LRQLHADRASSLEPSLPSVIKSLVSVSQCESYRPDAVRAAFLAALAPWGGMPRFVRPGMRVLLKPNLVKAAHPSQGITTHPVVVQVVAELVRDAGGSVQVGDSPAVRAQMTDHVLRETGMLDAAGASGAQIVRFESKRWQRLHELDYLVAAPVEEVDLTINLPKLKTHSLTLYTGAVKNLFGTIVGSRKRELHLARPGIVAFSQVLVDVLQLARPGLTIMDGILGIEGNGPGASGTPRHYRCLLASPDAVALDSVVAQAMGYRHGEVLHLRQAGERGLGAADPRGIDVVGDLAALRFGKLHLPRIGQLLRVPSWVTRPLRPLAHVRPALRVAECVGCGACVDVCPTGAMTAGEFPQLIASRCIGCLCCVEVCPQGALEPRRSLLARLIGIGR
jgi:uncharacterized protein (DUF362 family)/NAD-dependent dihydropyrimidine dehydrogenase PreA subunit